MIKLKYFKEGEFSNPDKMDEELLLKLDRAREIAGFAFGITSSYREDDELSHGKGKAVDFRIRGSAQRKAAVLACHEAGFLRIGIYDKHIHVDVDMSLPLGWWVGKSE